MKYENILVDLKKETLTITINRPEVLNALNHQTWHELSEAIDFANMEDGVKVVVITGAGEKSFVAGADVNWLNERIPNDMFKVSAQAVCNKINDCNKPVIAAINGYALGGGCEIVLACDIRYASKRAKIGQTEINLGIIPGAGGTQRLAKLIGEGKAKELIFTGSIISAEEANAMGLIDRVFEPEELMENVMKLADRISSRAPLAVQTAKRAINVGLSTNLSTGLEYELSAQAILYGTEDKKEGISAFLEKRKPEFKGV